ncbi:MAG: hypothetical protein JSW26_02010 [Desulfobacterales bacterium]|nr:MAG: hypothetical protein JSW26_02010 [Desulfobacterales bacterium]
MKISNMTFLRALAVLSTGLMIGACATTQIDIELSPNHPANSAAEAAAFVPPPNPFEMKVLDAQTVPPAGTAGDHPKHNDHPKNPEGAGHDHGMQKMKPPTNAQAGGSEKGTEHQH